MNSRIGEVQKAPGRDCSIESAVCAGGKAGIRADLKMNHTNYNENSLTDDLRKSHTDPSNRVQLMEELYAIAEGPIGQGAKVLLRADSINERLATFSELGGIHKHKREQLHRLLLSWSVVDDYQPEEVVLLRRAELVYAISQVQEELLQPDPSARSTGDEPDSSSR